MQSRSALYSKQGCSLCDGPKEKLQQVAVLHSSGPLSSARMEVRGTTTNSECEHAYQYEIPFKPASRMTILRKFFLGCHQRMDGDEAKLGKACSCF